MADAAPDPRLEALVDDLALYLDCSPEHALGLIKAALAADPIPQLGAL